MNQSLDSVLNMWRDTAREVEESIRARHAAGRSISDISARIGPEQSRPVWIVEDVGEWGDKNNLEAVFSTREKAESFIGERVKQSDRHLYLNTRRVLVDGLEVPHVESLRGS